MRLSYIDESKISTVPYCQHIYIDNHCHNIKRIETTFFIHNMSSILEQFAFPHVPCTYDGTLSYLEFVTREEEQSSWAPPKSHIIPIRYYDGHHKMTMIMCHGNGEDIGHADPAHLSNVFGVNVCVFDYAGYGLHCCQTASESACQDDAIAVYNYLIEIKGVNAKNIIIYGRSLGTWVACYLSHYLCEIVERPPLKLILISPLMSAVKTITNFWSPIDILMSYKLAPYITCSTLIIHGDKDMVVPYSCGVELSQLFPNLYRFITLYDIGHNNVITRAYYDSILQFIRR